MTNIYTLTLRNTVTGEKKVYRTHNVLTTRGIYAYAAHLPFFANGHGYGTNALHCGTGTGTPSQSDTALFKEAFTASSSDSTVKISYKPRERIDKNTLKCNITFVIPPASNYTANITEIGLACGSTLYTHALLVDSEGNQISVNKTDTDELTVSVDVYYQRGDVCFGEVVHAFQNAAPFMSDSSWPSTGFGSYSKNSRLILTKAANIEFAYQKQQSATGTNAWDGTKLTFSGYRFSTSNSPTCYVNSIMYSSSDGSWQKPAFGFRFPNAKVFPQRQLTGLALGTGDGSTKEFSPILPAWVKDTEVIYKNGTALTRDVDYTCDHLCNAKKDIGMTQGNFLMEIVQAHLTVSQNYGIDYMQYGGQAFIPGTCQIYEAVTWSYRPVPTITQDTPMILSYMEDPLVGNSINTIVPGSFRGAKTNTNDDSRIPAGTVITYSVSEDGTTYEDVLSITVSSSNNTFSDTTEHTLDKDYVMKYMKISVKWPDGTSDADKLSIYQSAGNSRFMHLGKGIVFSEAPAEGDVLTMDAGIDRPWKSSDYILDFNPIIQY